ncbi:hypothetical protein HGRIS_002540 [Hohenbuehelia grisea]|uniref:Uncharacterized protein n=1 Tax=Hohenbuehelia grisea TaxID=104357 RepID=A0ABR3JM65_9AGAR
MQLSTAPALFFGLGARILLDLFTRPTPPSVQDFILFGAWQGIALQYAFTYSEAGLLVACGIAGKLLLEFMFAQDITKCLFTFFGAAAGAIGTEMLSGVLDDPKSRTKKHSTSKTDSRDRDRDRDRTSHSKRDGHSRDDGRHRTARHSHSDITSVDSNSELIGIRPSMTPRERDIAALRARASLADTERRRFKEERKWAVSQGNLARASQMKWQVKRYAALMDSFNKQADALVVAGANERISQSIPYSQPGSSSSTPERHSRVRLDGPGPSPLRNGGPPDTRDKPHRRHRSGTSGPNIPVASTSNTADTREKSHHKHRSSASKPVTSTT